jgi:inorganic triphosphatase YgiF
MPNEIELKLDIDHAGAEAIERSGLDRQTSTAAELNSRYFDTPDHALRQVGMSLRLRDGEGVCVQTAKTGDAGSAGLFDRVEWELKVAGDRPVPDPRSPVGSLLGERWAELDELFTVTAARRTWRIATRKAAVALVIDRGEVRAGNRREPFCELELELLSGEPAALFELARKIGALAPVRIGVLSKAERGYRLLGALPASHKAAALAFEPMMDLADVFATVVRHCLDHYRRNEAILLQCRSVEAVHQARVALRRLRTALSLFRELIPQPQTAEFGMRLRRLAATLGDVRDLDVLLAAPLPGPLAVRLEAAREAAWAGLAATLSGAEARVLMLDLVAWLTCGTWRSDPQTLALRAIAPRKAAARLLDRKLRKVRRHSRHLAELHPEARHELRKDAKKLRYAIDFLNPLFPGKDQREDREAFVKALSKLQDGLGALNDRTVAVSLLNRLGLTEVEGAPALLASRDMASMLEIATKARKRLFALGPFWH